MRNSTGSQCGLKKISEIWSLLPALVIAAAFCTLCNRVMRIDGIHIAVAVVNSGNDYSLMMAAVFIIIQHRRAANTVDMRLHSQMFITNGANVAN